jgi:ankyrin repeat protein
MNYRQMEIRNARTKSCAWILENKAYMQWVEQKQGVLWIKGKPGSGKSTLMKKIFRLLNDDADDSPYCLSYFFHRRGGQLQRTELGMLRTLLYQLFKQEPELGTDLQSLFEENQKLGNFGSAWDWSLTNLRQIFRSALTAAAKIRPFRVFIDALDEGGEESARSIVSYLYDLEKDIIEGGSFASICFSCRHYPILGHNNELNICVEDENYDDIALYIDETLENILVTSGQQSKQDNDIEILKRTIVQKSSGVFLWATLVTPRVAEQFNEGKSLEMVLNTLRTVPVDIREVYRHILTEVLKLQDLSESLHLLQLISLATRPLSIEELHFAMNDAGSWEPSPDKPIFSTTKMTQRIISLSGGLAEVKEVVNGNDTTKIAQFIHQTVVDFLIQDRLKCLAPHSTENLIGQGHLRLAQACINSLKFGNYSEDQRQCLEKLQDGKFYPQNPLIWYAVKDCFFHVQQAEIAGFVVTQLQGESEDDTYRYLELWSTMYRNLDGPRARCPANSATILHVAACYNLHSTCRILLEKGADIEAEDKDGNRAIHYVARYGGHHIGVMLLNAGTSVSKTNTFGVDPLEEASLSGNADVVRLLLEHGAKVSEAALQNAVKCENIACVELLLQYKAPVDMMDLGHGNALFLAVRTGNFQIIGLLMHHYRANISTEVLNELLHAAAGEYNIAVVKLLLDHGAIAQAQGGWLGSPLLEAILVNEVGTVKLLLEHGADANAILVNEAGIVGPRREKMSETFEILLKKMVDLNNPWPQGPQGPKNALQVANRFQASPKIVNLLIEYGAEELIPTPEEILLEEHSISAPSSSDSVRVQVDDTESTAFSSHNSTSEFLSEHSISAPSYSESLQVQVDDKEFTKFSSNNSTSDSTVLKKRRKSI